MLVIALTYEHHVAVRHVFAKLPKRRRLKTKKIKFFISKFISYFSVFIIVLVFNTIFVFTI